MKKIFFTLIIFVLSITFTNAASCVVITGDGTNIGDQIQCNTEKFYVTYYDENNEKIFMLSAHKINPDLNNPTQNSSANSINFFETYYWKDSVETYPIWVYNENSNFYQYIQAYEEYLHKINVKSANATLISHTQLQELGCEGVETGNDTCNNSKYKDWIVIQYDWATGSAFYPYGIYIVYSDGIFSNNADASIAGIRPLVTISIDELNNEIEVKTDGNGTVTAIEKSKSGEEITFTVKPKIGYTLKEVKVTDADGNVIVFKDNTFTMPSSNVLIEATFEVKNPNTIAISVIACFIFTIVSFVIYKKYNNKINWLNN